MFGGVLIRALLVIMTKVPSIEFAPLKIPLRRLLQTLAALYWSTTFFVLQFAALFLFIGLLATRYYLISVIYGLWLYYDGKTCQRGGRRFQWVRKWKIWEHFRDYFPIKLIKTTDLDPKKNYIFGYHPHGILCASAFCHFATEATGFSATFPGITPTLVTLEGNFWFPFHREFMLACGLCSAARNSLEHIFTKQGKGNAAVIVIGGTAEMLDARPHQAVLTLANRKGFIKVALQLGVSLVPVFSFGENDIYQQAENPKGSKLRAFQNKFKDIMGFTPPAFWGRLGYLPFRHPIHTIVGKPIDVDQIDNPTEDDINKYHAMYISNLKNLFNEYKVKIDDEYKDIVMRIV